MYHANNKQEVSQAAQRPRCSQCYYRKDLVPEALYTSWDFVQIALGFP